MTGPTRRRVLAKLGRLVYPENGTGTHPAAAAEGWWMEFKAGDLVRLRSGGPVMTVEQVGKRAMTEEETVWCVWFEKVGNKQVPQRETFPPVTLERAEKRGLGAVGIARA